MVRPKNPNIVFLTGRSPLYSIIAHALVEKFGPLTILREEDEPKGLFFRRRVKILGPVAVAGQIAFGVLSKFIAKWSKARRAECFRLAGASQELPENCELIEIPSVNSDECRQALQTISPDVVMVVGTRIIGKKTLQCTNAPFINYHPGLTPKYRGMHGGYWTLASGDAENLAVTVHLVDENVDAGDVLYQQRLAMPPGNNIATYHYHMAVEARSIAVKAIGDALDGKLKPHKVDLPSKQWFHPTLWGYIWTGVTRGVW